MMIDPYLHAHHEESQRTSQMFEKMQTRNGDDSVIDEPMSDKKEADANDVYSSSNAN